MTNFKNVTKTKNTLAKFCLTLQLNTIAPTARSMFYVEVQKTASNLQERT